MLSLPPAFVLSQDQTLMLRIQSLALRHVLNRRELTPIFNQQQSEDRHRENWCCLLLKRDRQSLFPEPRSLKVPRAPPPTFLFLYIQLSKNRRTHHPSNRFQQARNSRLRPQNQPQPTKETLERRSSSPAAPPPSSVIGLIDPTPPTRQQTFSRPR